jgi:hypothetical protein
MRIFAAALITLASASIASCDQPSTKYTPSEPTNVVTQQSAATTPAKIARPSHRYDLKEGTTYTYVVGLSEEERKSGKAAGDALTFRYFGKVDGEHIVALLSDDGTVLSRSRCAEPCVVIKRQNGSKIAYSPDSVIGAVFGDAIAGHLIDSSVDAHRSASADSDKNTIPTAFRGEWSDDLTACGTGLSDARLRISASLLRFYESDGQVEEVVVHNPKSIRVRAAHSGEGDRWTTTWDLAISPDGKELVVASEGVESVRLRCS